ncbi:hypothetical protein AURDEDRAFT_169749 [Auricularia subglabra TFB-10046 SS5]|nr:hypothetical protein AURDEDRAFT_169749 [Auricularia subglabra TFB-10046 SS5]
MTPASARRSRRSAPHERGTRVPRVTRDARRRRKRVALAGRDDADHCGGWSETPPWPNACAPRHTRRASTAKARRARWAGRRRPLRRLERDAAVAERVCPASPATRVDGDAPDVDAPDVESASRSLDGTTQTGAGLTPSV